MKRIYLIILLLFGAWGSPRAQEAAENYVRTRIMQDERGTSYLDDIVYYDGLCRPYQHVQKGVTPSGQNLVSLQEYDAAGREWNAWLPAVSSAVHLSDAAFKSAALSTHANDTCPYSRPVYEASSLNRLVRQYGPGMAWKDAPVRTGYLGNDASDSLRCTRYVLDADGRPVSQGDYAPGLLSVGRTADEDGHVGYVFTDKLGRKVLTRRMDGDKSHDTYYVYDRYSNLCWVLQPMYQEAPALDLYAFQYRYDGRNRCIELKFPGAEPVKYVNDERDHRVFSQDGNQRSRGEWTFYLYDVRGRLVVQGICKNTDTELAEAYAVTGVRVPVSGSLCGSGYSSNFPLTDPVVHLVNYYDNYSFRELPGFDRPDFPSGTLSAQGFLTGKSVAVFGSDTRLFSAYYYDRKGRVTQTVSSNQLQGYDTTTLSYTFTGHPRRVTHVHTAAGHSTLTEVCDYTYDHASRLTKVEHTLNGSKVTLVENTYDELGRLSSRSFHGSEANGLSYSYNIRNQPTLIDGAKFTQRLSYAEGQGIPCYNGNISSMSWRVGNGANYRSYHFIYDGLDRLRSTNGSTGSGLIYLLWNDYRVLIDGYDLNGNITSMQRYANPSFDSRLIDDLEIRLHGNQLQSVNDAREVLSSDPSVYPLRGVSVDGVQEPIEYAYDANGNLIKDLNRDIVEIQYNLLNLPSKQTYGDGTVVRYDYTADGEKLRRVRQSDSDTLTRVYCGNAVYEEGALRYLLTDVGYVSFQEDFSYYCYYLKDHQGNNRVVVNSAGVVEETNHYYPFGGIADGSGFVQPYRYNGKEQDGAWYDYGARWYDAWLGRFTTMDPLAEKCYEVSPYAYCLNNPVKYVDPDGSQPRPARPVRRGYRNGGRPNPYAFYPGGIRPQSYKVITNFSYRGTGLRKQISLGKQSYLLTVNTPGGNEVQMSSDNKSGQSLSGILDFTDSYLEFKKLILDLREIDFSFVSVVKYNENGTIQKDLEMIIDDPVLAQQQLEYETKFRSIDANLGELDFKGKSITEILEISNERKKDIQDQIGLSPKEILWNELLTNPDAFQPIGTDRRILPEFREQK